MRIMVFFDLPVKTKKERRAAAAFRNFLLKDGFYMVQYSVYARTCTGMEDVAKHRERIRVNVPANGSIRMLTITEKQYTAIDVFLGNYHIPPEDKEGPAEPISFF